MRQIVSDGHPRVSGLLLLALLGLAASCGQEGGADRTTASESGALPAAVDPASRLRAAYVAARQAVGANDPAYAVRAGEDGALVATHPATHLRADLGARGAVLSVPGEPWHAAVAVTHVGCGAEAGVVVDRASARPRAAGPNRVEYAERVEGAGITEWYVHGPLGLEQGVTLESSPCDGAGGEVVIAVGVEGLAPALRAGGEAIDLRDPAGRTRVRYTDLAAHDAAGRALPARMAVEAGAIALHVDVRGARFPVVVDPLMWVQTSKLVPSDGGQGTFFGQAVAISGDTAIVGANEVTIGGNMWQGAAYVFVRSGGTWTQQQELLAGDGAAYDSFGVAVAIDGDTAIVGASDKSSTPGDPSESQGAAYVFVRSGGAWTQQQKLVPSDAAQGDRFGFAVALSGSTAVILGSAPYVFAQSGGTWTQRQKLPVAQGGVGAVATDGSTVVVASPGLNPQTGGAVEVYVPSGGTWTLQQKLVASDGVPGDALGEEGVAFAGSTIVVGAAGMTGNTPGKAYVFAQSGGTWTQQQKLVPSDTMAGDGFGRSVAIAGSTVVVGAPRVVVSPSAPGAAYVFTESGGVWTQDQELTASDGTPQNLFGWSVAIWGSNVVSSAMLADAAYTYTLGASTCSTDADCTSGAHCSMGTCVAGSSSSASSSGTGGASGTGGTSGTGGASSTGSASGTGGASSTGGAGGESSGGGHSGGGCAVRSPEGTDTGPCGLALGLLVVALGRARRRASGTCTARVPAPRSRW